MSLVFSRPSRTPSKQKSEHNTSDASAHGVTLDVDALAGTYTHPGYGTLTLCSPSSPSSYCAHVRSEFAVVDHEGDTGAVPDLLAAWPRFWTSHVRMRYRQAGHHAFDVYFTSLFPNGYGKDQTPFEWTEFDVPYGTAEFVVEGGRVVGFWMRVEEAVGEEVWFESV